MKQKMGRRFLQATGDSTTTVSEAEINAMTGYRQGKPPFVEASEDSTMSVTEAEMNAIAGYRASRRTGPRGIQHNTTPPTPSNPNDMSGLVMQNSSEFESIQRHDYGSALDADFSTPPSSAFELSGNDAFNDSGMGYHDSMPPGGGMASAFDMDDLGLSSGLPAPAPRPAPKLAAPATPARGTSRPIQSQQTTPPSASQLDEAETRSGNSAAPPKSVPVQAVKMKEKVRRADPKPRPQKEAKSDALAKPLDLRYSNTPLNTVMLAGSVGAVLLYALLLVIL